MVLVKKDFNHILTRYEVLHSEKTSTCSEFLSFVGKAGVFASLPMARENNKVKDSFIFDMPAILTCPNCETCAGNCYARVAQNMYEATKLKRWLNLYLFLEYPDELKKQINKQLARERVKRGKRFFQVRIHSSGDFFCQSYINFWHEIARENPDFTFFFFTKAEKLFDFSEFLALENVKRISSLLPDNDKNFGPESFIQEKLAKFGNKVAVCPCHNPKMERIEKDGNIKIECMRECKVCLKNKYVLIYEHK